LWTPASTGTTGGSGGVNAKAPAPKPPPNQRAANQLTKLITRAPKQADVIPGGPATLARLGDLTGAARAFMMVLARMKPVGGCTQPKQGCPHDSPITQ
jgi:hypothetical protein